MSGNGIFTEVFQLISKKAQKKNEDFVPAGFGLESPLLEAKQQIFLGSESFIAEAMRCFRESGVLSFAFGKRQDARDLAWTDRS